MSQPHKFSFFSYWWYNSYSYTLSCFTYQKIHKLKIHDSIWDEVTFLQIFEDKNVLCSNVVWSRKMKIWQKNEGIVLNFDTISKEKHYTPRYQNFFQLYIFFHNPYQSCVQINYVYSKTLQNCLNQKNEIEWKLI